MGSLFNIPNVSSLLTVINQVQNELGLPASTTIINNTDPTTVQMLALTARVNDDIRRMHPTGWSALYREFNLVVNAPTTTTGNVTNNSATITNVPAGVITTINGATAGPTAWSVGGGSVVGQASGQIPQAARVLTASGTTVTMNMQATGTATGASLVFSQDTYQYPTDWDWTQNRTHWDRTNRWELLGPDSPQMDQWHRSGIVATGPRRHWRSGLLGNIATAGANGANAINFLGRGFRLWPQPAEIANPLQIVFEYISTNSILSANNISNSFTLGPIQVNNTFNKDNDFSLMDDQALMLGLKWQFWRVKGFNVDDWRADWLDYCDQLIARDEGAGTLSLTKRVHPIFLSPSNVQDGFFPGPVSGNAA